VTLDILQTQDTSLGARLADGLGLSFAQTFVHQFIVSRHPRSVPMGWRDRALNGINLFHCPSLPAAQINDAHGTPCGWVLGIALRCKGFVIKDTFTVPAVLGHDDFMDVFTKHVTYLSGRYVVILASPDTARVYTDPVGDLA